jgi:hypothetical protein
VCLTVRVEPTALSGDALRRIAAEQVGSPIHFGYEGAGGILHRHPARLTLHACDLLTDGADWNAATWAMTPGAAAELADAFAFVLDRSPSGITAEARWDGDTPDTTTPLSRESFLELVRTGQLGTKDRYIVEPTRDIRRR